MTAEIAIMNRYAVVLAADSATTVSYWIEGKRSERYFKGANKLFQLSEVQPIGLMIYGSATLHGVPWEIIVKEFRRVLAAESLPRLTDYCQKFSDFVKGQSVLFPDGLRKSSLIENATIAAYQVHARLVAAIGVLGVPVPEAASRTLDAIDAEHSAAAPPECFDAASIEAAVAAHVHDVEKVVIKEKLLDSIDATLSKRLAEAAIRRAILHYKELMPSTGVVIAGYGTDEFFPSFQTFDCYGFLDAHFLWLKASDEARIDENMPARIEPFATTSMINTFQMGISPDVFEKVMTATRQCLGEFADALLKHWQFEGPTLPIDGVISDFAESHKKAWFYPSVKTHYGPLARIIGSLPVTDMAALARSLIELESLKERVTEPTESVAGPIDVAVISKHDGFVWIERKHYFSPELNPRYFQRRATRG